MKINIILLLITFTLFGCNQKSNANENTGKSGTTENIKEIFALTDYQQDFEKMTEILVKNHPQPYAFISEDSLKKLINLQYDKITDSTTIGEFLWICKSVVTAINCGHTNIMLPAKFGRVSKSLLFPIKAKYVNSRLYIVDAKNNSDKVSEGDEILKINGVDVETLQKEIFQHLPSDGFNETVKHESTNLYFYWFSSMFFDFPTSYTVTVKQNGNMEEIKLEEAVNLEAKKTFLDDCENQLCFDMNQESSTAIITIRSFGYYGKKRFPIFESFVDSCFYQIKENKIQNLIIDLRNNTGGDPFCGSYLLQHLANKSFTYFHKDIKRYSDLKKTIQPSSNGFKNKPYILINGLCFSTTGHFCSLVKENNLGIFVGDETAGTYTCNDFSKNFTLKNTKLTLRVARQICKTTASNLTNEHGIIPDYYVIPNIDNILNNTDTVLNYTLKLIEKE
ncbi:MAG: hypothetical protein JEY96_05855 [Bacteroidales bacterium]|nr:hypothetical protein [Bacteroidales bacterium]